MLILARIVPFGRLVALLLNLFHFLLNHNATVALIGLFIIIVVKISSLPLFGGSELLLLLVGACEESTAESVLLFLNFLHDVPLVSEAALVVALV